MTPLIVAVCLTALPLVLNAAGPSAAEMALYQARRHGALARELIRVVNQNGEPVLGASVIGAMQTGEGMDDYSPIRGITNTNGEFVISGKCTNRLCCDIVKNGYYDTSFVLADIGYTRDVSNGKWQPYGERHDIVLKQVKNPIVQGRRFILQVIPKYDEWIGYDFKCADWVKPLGEGEFADVMLLFTKRINGNFDFAVKMELSFEHQPFAGAYVARKDVFSQFQSDYFASTNVVYKNLLAFEVDRAGKKRVWEQLDNESFLVFRTRTEVDENGCLTKAHYGRIDGLWKFHERNTMRLEGIFFNDIPNDLNLEDKFSYEEQRRREQQREETCSTK